MNHGHRSVLARLRGGTLPLLLELGRYRRPKIPRSERHCTLCDMEEVEDELHFVFQCPRLAEARKPLLLKCEECWPGFGSVPEVERFSWIVNNEGIISFVAKTIFRMFTLRRTLM